MKDVLASNILTHVPVRISQLETNSIVFCSLFLIYLFSDGRFQFQHQSNLSGSDGKESDSGTDGPVTFGRQRLLREQKTGAGRVPCFVFVRGSFQKIQFGGTFNKNSYIQIKKETKICRSQN